MEDDERRLRWRSQLQAQAGVVSREQARDANLTAKAIDWRLRSGSWQPVHQGVYATFTGPLPREAKLWAAVLRAGNGVALSHETAAEIHGLIDRPIRQIHVSVPAKRQPGRHRKIRGVTVHRSRRLAREWQPPWQLPRTSYVHGVERAHRLPQAQRQAKRRHGGGIRYLDNLYEEFGVCVELDGVAAHPAENRWQDTHRDNANLIQGPRTLRYGWPDATVHRCRTAVEIAAVLRRHGWQGTLYPCSPT